MVQGGAVMAIKPIQIRPKGTGDFADVLHPETSVAQVVGLQDEITRIDNASNGNSGRITDHQLEKASKTTFGHVKIGSGINVVDGEISVSEMTATNVSTTQGSSVQETLDSLKSVTDNKIQSVATAIVSKGGTVAGTPPTAVQLVDGVNSIPTGGTPYPNNSTFYQFQLTGVDEKDNQYYINDIKSIASVRDKNQTVLQNISLGTDNAVGITKHGYMKKVGNDQVEVYALNGTLLKTITRTWVSIQPIMREDGGYAHYLPTASSIYSFDKLNTAKTLIASQNYPILFLNKKGKFACVAYSSNIITEMAVLDESFVSRRVTQVTYAFPAIDILNW